MKLLVIGSSLEDHITFERTTTVKPGGIFYSAAGLYNYIGKNDSFCLVTSVRKNDSLFSPLYDSISKEYFNYIDEIPVINLEIFPDKERSETYKNISGSLKLPFENLTDFDGALINMITGFDVTLEQLITFRKNFNKPVFLDVHSLARGMNDKLERVFRKIPDFHLWAKNLDIIQVNCNELLTLSCKTDEIEIAEEILSYGVKQLIVTMDELGAKVYYKINDHLVSVFVKAIPVNSINKVGCGDVFGAVYFYHFVKTGSIVNSLRLANIAAGMVTTYNDYKLFSNLNTDVFEQLY